MVVAGCRDAPLRSGGRGLVIVASPGEHRCPRGIEGALPGRVLCVRNVETPSGSGLRCGAGWWADREESRSPGRAKDGQEANAGGGNAAGNRDVQISALLLMVAEQPAGYGSSWPGRESGLTWSGEPVRSNDEAIFRTDGQAGHRDGRGRRGERTRGRSLRLASGGLAPGRAGGTEVAPADLHGVTDGGPGKGPPVAEVDARLPIKRVGERAKGDRAQCRSSDRGRGRRGGADRGGQDAIGRHDPASLSAVYGLAGQAGVHPQAGRQEAARARDSRDRRSRAASAGRQRAGARVGSQV